MNYRWGDFGEGAGIDVPHVPTAGRMVTVPEGPYLLTVDGGTVHIRIGDNIRSGEGTPLPRGTLLQIYVPTEEAWAVSSDNGLARLTLTREEPIDQEGRCH